MKWQKTESLKVTVYQVHKDNRGGDTPKKSTTHLSIQLVNAYDIHTATHHLITHHICLYNHLQGVQTPKILLKLEHMILPSIVLTTPNQNLSNGHKLKTCG